MIVLRSPKGWTGPKVVDGLQIEGTFRAHQVPILVNAEFPEHVALLESWMKSYKAEELFDRNGRLIRELAELAPKGNRRMGSNPHANGGTAFTRPDHAGFLRSCGACALAGSRGRVGHSRTGRVPARRGKAEPGRAETSACSDPTRRSPTCSARFLKSPAASGTPEKRRTMSSSRPPGRCWIPCSASTSARVGWKVTYSPGGTDCSTATRHSFELSIRCSANTPSG